ncbi:MAG: hypothetical protein ACXVQS_09650 [Actinomycetota bacterium]
MPTRREDSFVWERSGGWTARLREPRPVFSKLRALVAALIAIAAITAAIGLSPTGSRELEGVRESQVRAAQKITVAVLLSGTPSGQKDATGASLTRYDIYRFDRTGRATLCRSIVADYVEVGDVSGTSVLVSGAKDGQSWIESFSITACKARARRLVVSSVLKAEGGPPTGWMCPSWSPDRGHIAATLMRPAADHGAPVAESWVGDADGAGWHKVTDGIGCGWVDGERLLLGMPRGLLEPLYRSADLPEWARATAVDVGSGRVTLFTHPEVLGSRPSPDGSQLFVVAAFDGTDASAALIDVSTGALRLLDPPLVSPSLVSPFLEEVRQAWRADGNAFLVVSWDGIWIYDAAGRRTDVIQMPTGLNSTAGWVDESTIWVAGESSLVLQRIDGVMERVDLGRISSLDVTPVGVRRGLPRPVESVAPEDIPNTAFPTLHVHLRIPPSWEVVDLAPSGAIPEGDPARLLVTLSSQRSGESVMLGWTSAPMEAVLDVVPNLGQSQCGWGPCTAEKVLSTTVIDGHPFVAFQQLGSGFVSSFASGLVLVGTVNGRTYIVWESSWEPTPYLQMLLDSIRFES